MHDWQIVLSEGTWGMSSWVCAHCGHSLGYSKEKPNSTRLVYINNWSKGLVRSFTCEAYVVHQVMES
jgi:hypothetical protein